MHKYIILGKIFIIYDYIIIYRIDSIGPSFIDGPFEIRLLQNGIIIELRTKEKLASIENQRTKYNNIKLCFKIMGIMSYKMT